QPIYSERRDCQTWRASVKKVTMAKDLVRYLRRLSASREGTCERYGRAELVIKQMEAALTAAEQAVQGKSAEPDHPGWWSDAQRARFGSVVRGRDVAALGVVTSGSAVSAAMAAASRFLSDIEHPSGCEQFARVSATGTSSVGKSRSAPGSRGAHTCV